MKKLIVMLMTLLLLLSTSFVFVANAESVTTLSVGSSTASPGEKVAVPVELSNNQGIWGMMFNIRFNTDVFEVDEVRNNGEVFTNGDIMIGPDDFNKGYVRFVITPNIINKNNTSNGVISTIIFNVKEDAPLIDYNFEIDYEENHISNIDNETVEITTKNGTVSLVKAQNIKQEQTKSNEEYGDLAAEADENNRLITKSTIGYAQQETEAQTSVEKITDKNKELVTNSNGEQQTKIYKADENGKFAEVKETENNQNNNSVSENTQKDEDSNNLSDFVLWLIGIIAVALIIVLIVFLVIKKKK